MPKRSSLGRNPLQNDASKLRPLIFGASTPSGTTDHGSLTGLADDDHSQYVHISADRTITAQHTFSPSSPQAPFVLGANAQGQLVTGLNADELDSLTTATNATAAYVLATDGSGYTAANGFTGNTYLYAGAAGVYFKAGSSAVVVNDSNGDIDFRAEGDNDAALFNVDASGDKVGIGVLVPDRKLEIYDNTNPQLRLTYADNTQYADFHYKNGELSLITTGNFIWNEAQAAIDFILSGDTEAYLLFIDGSADRVGVGTNTPGAWLDVQGGTEQLRLSYDSDSYASFTTGSTSQLTIATAESGNLVLAPAGNITINPTGDNVLPETSYQVNLGSPIKKYLTLHAAELWVQTLVAESVVATIGGHLMVVPTTELAEDVSNTELTISNPSFETAGGGGADVFAAWTEAAGSGTITRDTSVYRGHDGGAASCRLNYVTGAAYVYSDNIACTAETYYCLTFWARRSSASEGRYQVYDVTNAADIIASTPTVISAQDAWERTRVTFVTPAGCVNLRVYLRSHSTTASAVYFDDLHIIPAEITVKHNQMTTGDIIRLEAGGYVEFMQAASEAVANGDNWDYSVYRDLDNTGANTWSQGDAVINTGQSSTGFMDLYSMESIYGRSPDYIHNVDYNGGSLIWSANYAGSTNWQPFADNANTEYQDALYIGNAAEFNQFVVFITTAAVHDANFVVGFWDGATWTAVSDLVVDKGGTVQSDMTGYLEQTGTWRISFTLPTTWVKSTLNSALAYWLRIRISSFTSWSTLPESIGKHAHIGKSQWGPSIVGWVRNSTTYSDVSEVWALGNLNGLYGYGGDTYGSAFGKYAASNTWVSLDATNGFRVNLGTTPTTIGQWDTSGVVTIGNSASRRVRISDSTVYMYDDSGDRILIANSYGIFVGNYDHATTPAYVQVSTGGIYFYNDGILTGHWQMDGDIFIGSDISAAGSTYFSVFATAQTYNTESMAAGDMLIGDNSTSKANILWDKSAGQLLFRGGQTAAAYIDTDGAITAGGGDVVLDSSGLTINPGSSGVNQVKWGTTANQWAFTLSTTNYMVSDVDANVTETTARNEIRANGNVVYLARATHSGAVTADITADTITLAGTEVETSGWATYTANPQGFSSVTSNTAYRKTIGKLVFVQFLFGGTSNTTDFTFTLPYTPSSSMPSTMYIPVRIRDNSTTYAVGTLSLVGGSATATLYPDLVAGSWTASNTKSAMGEFWYQAS